MKDHRPCRHGVVRCASTLAVVLGLVGCSGNQMSSTLPDFMYAHFGQVGRVQTAVILGDLRSAQAAARQLAETATHPDIPEEGRSAFVRMRWHAGQVAEATTLGTAAAGAAGMAGTCGECHAAVGGGPRLSLEASPPPNEPSGPHMLRHLWAADRLWEGIIGPSDELWDLGARELAGEPIELAEGTSSVARELARRVHDLGGQARSTRSLQARVELYSELLSTCSDCHEAVWIGGHRP